MGVGQITGLKGRKIYSKLGSQFDLTINEKSMLKTKKKVKNASKALRKSVDNGDLDNFKVSESNSFTFAKSVIDKELRVSDLTNLFIKEEIINLELLLRTEQHLLDATESKADEEVVGKIKAVINRIAAGLKTSLKNVYGLEAGAGGKADIALITKTKGTPNFVVAFQQRIAAKRDIKKIVKNGSKLAKGVAYADDVNLLT